MPQPPPKKPSGRPISDEKGNRTWEWHSNSKVDTGVVKALGDDLSIASSTDAPQDSNPYERGANNPPREGEKKRRTLDDMRRLSDTIKRSKHWTRDK